MACLSGGREELSSSEPRPVLSIRQALVRSGVDQTGDLILPSLVPLKLFKVKVPLVNEVPAADKLPSRAAAIHYSSNPVFYSILDYAGD